MTKIRYLLLLLSLLVVYSVVAADVKENDEGDAMIDESVDSMDDLDVADLDDDSDEEEEDYNSNNDAGTDNDAARKLLEELGDENEIRDRMIYALGHLSEACRGEFQAQALDHQKEISGECSTEMMSMIRDQKEKFNERKKAKASGSDPKTALLSFVGLLFAGLISFGVYSSYYLVPQTSKPVKKLSKQKIQKEKMKAQRRKQAGLPQN